MYDDDDEIGTQDIASHETLRRAADGRQQLLEPIHLLVDGGVHPEALAEASLVVELKRKRRGRDEGEVYPLVEAHLLGGVRRQVRQSDPLSYDKQSARLGTSNSYVEIAEKGGETDGYR